MHYTNTAIAGISALFILGFSQPCLAGDSPTQIVNKGAENVRQILKKKVKKGSPAEAAQKKELKKTVEGILDYHELAKRALGPHWKARTDKEREEFIGILRDLIESSYTGSIRNNVNFNLEIEDEELDFCNFFNFSARISHCIKCSFFVAFATSTFWLSKINSTRKFSNAKNIKTISNNLWMEWT